MGFLDFIKKAATFVEEQSKNIEQHLDSLKEQAETFVQQQQLIANQNENQKKQAENATTQIFEDLNGATVKFLTPDGKFIASYVPCFIKTGVLHSHYDFRENEVQILKIYHTNHKHEQVKEVICSVVPYSYFTPEGFGNVYLGGTGGITLDITTSVTQYQYVIGSTNVVDKNYGSADIYISTDENAGKEFLIIEEILKHLPKECSEMYHNTTAQRLEKSKETLDKNMFEATIKNLAERPFTGVQEIIAKFGAPKFQSFTSKSGEVIPFKGDLFFWQPENSKVGENRGFAHYIDLNGELTFTSVIIENEKVDYIRVETAPFSCLRGNPHTGHCEISISTERSNYLDLRSGISDYMKSCSYTNLESNEEEDKYISTQEAMYLPTHSLEEVYILASRISLVIGEYNGRLMQDYILQHQNGTFIKQEQVEQEENEDFDDSYSDNSSSSNSSSSNSKVPKIKLELQNKNGADDVYLVFENNKPYGGTGRVGKGFVTSYYFVPGAVIKLKNGGVIYNVTEDTKTGTRVQV